jgi:hypothetical protein
MILAVIKTTSMGEREEGLAFTFYEPGSEEEIFCHTMAGEYGNTVSL